MGAALRLTHVSKRYGDCVSVREASFEAVPGRIHAVCGENGAGKSTLLKMAAGLVVPDSGSVQIDGIELAPHSPAAAIHRGVGMVVQHFSLIGALTVLENVVLGSEPAGMLGRLQLGPARERVRTLASALGVKLPLDARADELGVGDKQRLEIVRCLYRDAKILILDEPTAVLTPEEARSLYAMLRKLADAGTTIVVVTHKLDEVRAYCDEATVMRKGEVIFSRVLAADERESIIQEITKSVMGDHAATSPASRNEKPSSRPSLSVEEVRVGRGLLGVSFEVAVGEVVGIAGVEGNGQRELVDTLAGLEAPDSGRVSLEGSECDVARLRELVAVVFEDRQREGLVLGASIENNVLLGDLSTFSRVGWLDTNRMHLEAKARVTSVGAPQRLNEDVRSLSGGNQQKVVVARALAHVRAGAKVLVLSHPTRGVDLGARAAIWELIREAKRDIGVVVVSSDLDELKALSDRLLVMSRGAVVATFPPSASEEELGRAMLGVGGAP